MSKSTVHGRRRQLDKQLSLPTLHKTHPWKAMPFQGHKQCQQVFLWGKSYSYALLSEVVISTLRCENNSREMHGARGHLKFSVCFICICAAIRVLWAGCHPWAIVLGRVVCERWREMAEGTRPWSSSNIYCSLVLDGATHLAAALPDWLDGYCVVNMHLHMLWELILPIILCVLQGVSFWCTYLVSRCNYMICKPDLYILCIMYDKLLKNK